MEDIIVSVAGVVGVTGLGWLFTVICAFEEHRKDNTKFRFFVRDFLNATFVSVTLVAVVNITLHLPSFPDFEITPWFSRATITSSGDPVQGTSNEDIEAKLDTLSEEIEPLVACIETATCNEFDASVLDGLLAQFLAAIENGREEEQLPSMLVNLSKWQSDFERGRVKENELFRYLEDEFGPGNLSVLETKLADGSTLVVSRDNDRLYVNIR